MIALLGDVHGLGYCALGQWNIIVAKGRGRRHDLLVIGANSIDGTIDGVVVLVKFFEVFDRIFREGLLVEVSFSTGSSSSSAKS